MNRPSPLGLIAGNGEFPLLIAGAARGEGRKLVAAAHRGETRRELKALVEKIFWIHLGEIGKLVRFFRNEGVREILIAGGVDKKKMFSHIRMDAEGGALWQGLENRRDDFILRRFAEALEKEGFVVRPSTMFLPSLTAPAGVLTRRQPTEEEKQDIAFGWSLAKELGRLDIGQCLVVRNRAVLAVEAIEGTDETIRRGGILARKQAVVIKVCKPDQDLRFDLPAVGERTIETMREVKARVLAIEAGKTIIFNRKTTLHLADKYGMVIVSI
jgi:hypothetical protein